MEVSRKVPNFTHICSIKRLSVDDGGLILILLWLFIFLLLFLSLWRRRRSGDCDCFRGDLRHRFCGACLEILRKCGRRRQRFFRLLAVSDEFCRFCRIHLCTSFLFPGILHSFYRGSDVSIMALSRIPLLPLTCVRLRPLYVLRLCDCGGGFTGRMYPLRFPWRRVLFYSVTFQSYDCR